METGRDATPTLLEVATCSTRFSVRGSFVDRLRGREAGAVQAVDGVSFDLRPRRGARAWSASRARARRRSGAPCSAWSRRRDGSIRFEGEEITGLTRVGAPRRCAGGCRSSSRIRTPR